MRHLVLAGLLAGLAACMGNAPPPVPLNPVRFLLINDVYVADTMVDGRGGLARVATVRQDVQVSRYHHAWWRKLVR